MDRRLYCDFHRKEQASQGKQIQGWLWGPGVLELHKEGGARSIGGCPCFPCPFLVVLTPAGHRTLKQGYPLRSNWANSLVYRKSEKVSPEKESNFFKATQHFKAAELDLEFMSPAIRTTTQLLFWGFFCFFFFSSSAEFYISQTHQTVNVLKSEFLSLLMSYSQYVWNTGDAQHMIVSVSQNCQNKIPQTSMLKTNRFIVSQVWRLVV